MNMPRLSMLLGFCMVVICAYLVVQLVAPGVDNQYPQQPPADPLVVKKVAVSDVVQAGLADNTADVATKNMMSDLLQKNIDSTVNGFFSSSLAMRENADFLLTPGFAVEESLSNEILPTYPED